MQTYADFQPTGFDPAGAFLEDDRQNWLVVPVARTRDSGPLAESNFAQALEALGGESDTVEVHRFGHWGPGWFEIIIVKPDTPESAIADDLETALENYPVLDEMDLSEREAEASAESYDSWARRDFIRELTRRFQVDDTIDTPEVDSRIDEIFQEAADRSNTYWEADGDGMTIDVGRIVAAVTWEEAIDVLEFITADAAEEIAEALAAILDTPQAGAACALAGGGLGMFRGILGDLRRGEFDPREADCLLALFARLDLFPELEALRETADNAYWELEGIPA